MKAITRHIPNAITSLNLFSGCVAIVFAFRGSLDIAAYCIFAAAIFDFCDGFAARLLKAYSPLGLQLDSLADVVSFGVAPAAMLHVTLTNVLTYKDAMAGTPLSQAHFLLSLLPFIIAVFSALRLAKFNIDTRQTESFLGLPTPANALLIASALAASQFNPSIAQIVNSCTVIIAASIILSALLVSEIPMFSLKFKKQASAAAFFQKYLVQITFAVICLLSPLFFGLFCVAAMIILYISLSIFRWLSQLRVQNRQQS